jgi:hypothetical protein
VGPAIAVTRRRPVRLAALAAAIALVAALAWALRDSGSVDAPEPKPARHASTRDLDKVLASAMPGDTILLAPGDYGSFAGAAKRGTVTIRPEPGAAARMQLAFRKAANLRLEGLTIDGGEIRGRTRDVTIAGSRFAGQVVIRANRMRDAGIVLERNRFAGIDVCEDCYEGRIQIVGDAGHPSGVVIRENVLGPGGNTDGIQVGGNGVQIIGNEFVGLRQGGAPSDPHTDALQLYGQRNTVIRGNYFRDVSTGIMAPDGGRHERIEHNVFDIGDYPYAIMLGGDDGSTIRHNTMAELGGCAWGVPCGTLNIGPDHAGRSSRGTVVTDNILGSLSLAEGTELKLEGNVVAVGAGAPGTRPGRPAFAGGAHPTARAGFRLAAGSVGAGEASDGTDVGAALP